MTDWCPGSCNTAWRKTVGGPICPHACDHLSCREIRHATYDPIAGEPVWCRRDAARIRGRLADHQILAALLEHASDGYGEAPEEPAHGSNGHAPSPSPGFDTLDEIERMFRAWEAEYLHVQGWGSPPVHGHWASVSYEIYVFLNRHFDGILESPFAREFGDEVLGAARHLALKAKASSTYKIGRVPCPRCEYLMLFSTDGGEVFWCASCGRPVRKDEYDELCIRATPANASR